MKNAKLEGMQKGGNMMKKVFGIMMVLVMMASFIAVPASAESNVTLLETWFEDADGVKVYDTSAAKTVNPVFYVNNSGDAAVTDANIILASYDADKRLKSVNYATAPEIPVGESRIEIAETVDTAVGGEAYMMIWKDYDPVVEKEVLSAKSRQAEILSFSVNGTKGLITEEALNVTYNSIPSVDDTISKSYSMEKSINVILPYRAAYADAKQDLTAIVPVIELPEGAKVSPSTEEAQDFSEGKTVEYTVTAADGVTTAKYTVSVIEMDRKVYKETVGADFAVLSYEDMAVNGTKSIADVMPAEGVDSGTSYGGGISSNKIFMTSNSVNTAKLKYTREKYNDGEYVLRNGEKLSDWYRSDGTTLVSEDENTEEANTDVAYVLDKDGNNVLTSDLTVDVDPTNPENYCIRYDKRAAGAIHMFYKGGIFSSSGNVYKSAWNGFGGSHKKLLYNMDIYIPRNLPYKAITRLLIEPADSASLNQTYGVTPNNAKNTMTFYVSKSDSTRTAGTTTLNHSFRTLPNALDRWVNVKYELDYTGTSTQTKMYIDNKLFAKFNFTNQGKFIKTLGRSYNTYIWGVGGSEQAHLGTILMDNIEISAMY